MLHKTIVKIINEAIAAKFKDQRFQNSVFYGTADASNAGPFTLEGKSSAHVGLDSKNVLTVYHKTNSDKHREDLTRSGGDKIAVKVTREMSLIAMLKRESGVSKEDLSMLIASGFPNSIRQIELADFKSTGCSVKLVGTNYNAQSIIDREYMNQNTPVILTEMIVIEVMYTYECLINSSCINILNC